MHRIQYAASSSYICIPSVAKIIRAANAHGSVPLILLLAVLPARKSADVFIFNY
jgi:hypothetical protein